MESNNIDSLATRKKIRTVYGSVRSFCREAELTDTYPSLLLTEPRRGQRGEGQKVLQRLDSEGLIVYLLIKQLSFCKLRTSVIQPPC
jgi:hypothetical protein